MTATTAPLYTVPKYSEPLLLVPGDQVTTGPLGDDAQWRTVTSVSACPLPTVVHGDGCTVVLTHDGTAVHARLCSLLWHRRRCTT